MSFHHLRLFVGPGYDPVNETQGKVSTTVEYMIESKRFGNITLAPV